MASGQETQPDAKKQRGGGIFKLLDILSYVATGLSVLIPGVGAAGLAATAGRAALTAGLKEGLKQGVKEGVKEGVQQGAGGDERRADRPVGQSAGERPARLGAGLKERLQSVAPGEDAARERRRRTGSAPVRLLHRLMATGAHGAFNRLRQRDDRLFGRIVQRQAEVQAQAIAIFA